LPEMTSMSASTTSCVIGRVTAGCSRVSWVAAPLAWSGARACP
jgi:hypothetical protein